MSGHPACDSTPIECTGAQAGLSGPQQIVLLLTTLHKHGGSATMDKLYEAVNVAIAPHRLSVVGKAAVRCYINRACAQQGWVEAHTEARKTALWRLTAAGEARVAPVVPLPRPRSFAEPLLRALGKLSRHTLSPMSRTDAMRAVLAESGYDPDAPPRGWMDLTSNGQPKVYEALRWLVRSMDTLVSTPVRGQWALTVLGLERAAKLNGVHLLKQPVVKKTTTGPNITSQWFTKHLTPPRGQKDSELMLMMKGALARHLPLSGKWGFIEDHIQNFMVRVIRRDSFATVLSKGGDLPYTKVAAYCVNSGRSDVRDMGTEPVCREMLGARTDKERRGLASQFPVRVNPCALRDTDGNVDLSEMLATEMGFEFEAVWDQIIEAVRVAKPGAWERYSGVLRMRFEGYSTQEIAEKEGVSRHRVANMVATVRQIVRDSAFAL